jgi:hypothetical protein
VAIVYNILASPYISLGIYESIREIFAHACEGVLVKGIQIYVNMRAVDPAHKSSGSFIKSQYILIMVNLLDISSPPRESSGCFFDL